MRLCSLAIFSLIAMSPALNALNAQNPQSVPPLSPTPASEAATPANSEPIQPSWDTQKLARTTIFSIPAPRGQITDRNGAPLAQSRVAYNLALQFPTPNRFSDAEALVFAHSQLQKVSALLHREIAVSDAKILRHYKNRGAFPMEIADDLKPEEIEKIKRDGDDAFALKPIYLRTYPDGTLAAHILGYVGREGRPSQAPVVDNELLWPQEIGREGIEQTFNGLLTGKLGQLNVTFNAQGKRASERVAFPPKPGDTVVMTLDKHIQELCEKALAQGVKRGAIVVTDPNNGDILAMASWPTFDPNDFVPNISTKEFKALNDNPNHPLIPRTFRAAYPPGSTFKVFVGLAALASGKITPDQEFSGPAALRVGNRIMHNWKHSDAGMLNFAGALEQSCDTWFYQVGIKIGSAPILDWAAKCGFGQRTGIPLNAESPGAVPNDETMMKRHHRKLLDGDIANISIGQGDLLVTPLQMAQAMGIVANGGLFYQTRLVMQVQKPDGQVVTAYPVRLKADLKIAPAIMKTLRKAMVSVVSGGSGTAHRAEIDGVQVAGKTGTAQWGPKKKERNVAWFAGFAPAQKPQYAFAVVYESDVGQSAHGGTYCAPIIAKVLRQLFKEQRAAAKDKANHKAGKNKKAAKQHDESDDDTANHEVKPAPKKAHYPKPGNDDESN